MSTLMRRSLCVSLLGLSLAFGLLANQDPHIAMTTTVGYLKLFASGWLNGFVIALCIWPPR